MKEALLALEDGFVLRGRSFGADARALGEVCFNTSMTGYQEILTDPSYKGQIVAMTYPEIGNTGVNLADVESHRPHVSALVVRSLSPLASNWRSTMSLPDYLAANDVPGLCGVDTRALTKHLRSVGARRGVITTEKLSDAAAVALAASVPYLGVDFVEQVTVREPFVWDESDTLSRAWAAEGGPALPPVKYDIAAYDFGIKYNILRRLRQAGFRTRVFPARTPAAEVLATHPDGVFLSNGPGDPEALGYAHQAVRDLVGKKPLFGICLGHQILSFALGGGTFKLKFGHRGGNQPVKDLRTGRVSITSQNHGFAVDPDRLPKGEAELTHVNLNDNTCEGFRLRDGSAFAVQYHPEASPGPHDAQPHFAEFAAMIDKARG
jgi:carbamoyl-phosphate synthase small subunit